MTESIRAFLVQKPSLDEIIKQAESEGMGNLYTDGLEKVVDGITTIDELVKVIG
jgi:type II secretory ATPase GspE/PulE/Tfp pilus assembly ATPase PilB-like protein